MSRLAELLKDIFWKPDNINSDADSSLASLTEEDKENLSSEDFSALEKCLKNVNDAALKCGKPSEEEIKKEAKRFTQENPEAKDENDKNNEKGNKPKDKELEDNEQRER